MELSQTLLGLMFSLSLVSGLCMGILWSCLRLFRGLLGTECQGHMGFRVVRACLLIGGDVLFCLTCSVWLILLLYYTNDGQFRLLSVLGCACGFLGWLGTLGFLLGKCTDRLCRGLHRLIRRSYGWCKSRFCKMWVVRVRPHIPPGRGHRDHADRDSQTRTE